jgi:LmbE family N-acetylglucosaminyl deacetylase
MHAVATPALTNAIRYNDRGSYLWLWAHAPCSWKGNVELRFATVPLGSLQPAGTLMDPAVVAAQLRRMQRGRALAPPVVSATESGTWYIHDGNHRYEAMQTFFSGFSGNREVSVRVAIAVPNAAYQFRYRWCGMYGTYLLEPVASLLSTNAPGPFIGRTMVLVAHQDDETACAGLLQRLVDPLVVFATDGAPADEYFWGRYGSRLNYATVRRNEAEASLAKAQVSKFEFLSDHAPAGTQFRDQQLYRVLPQAFNAVCNLVGRYRPDIVLVPAYEGGHPDHDSCSFLGALQGRLLGLPVWETPLYHRSETGKLVCQEFRSRNGTERALVLSPHEKRTRDSMIATYASQTDVPDFVRGAAEQFRPQPEYDYSRRPHAGTLNYEAWQWLISSNEVCRAFQNCARALENVESIHSLPFAPRIATPATATDASAGA